MQKGALVYVIAVLSMLCSSGAPLCWHRVEPKVYDNPLHCTLATLAKPPNTSRRCVAIEEIDTRSVADNTPALR
jgi:hypothetical protein